MHLICDLSDVYAITRAEIENQLNDSPAYASVFPKTTLFNVINPITNSASRHALESV